MKKGQRLSRDALRTQLDSAGYRHVDQVMEHGEYATRGALLDLFPMGSELPYRLDFFDDEIDSLRVFDVDSQRTLEEVEAINLLPAHEFPTDKAAIELFRSQWRDTFEVKRDPEHIYQQVSKGTLPAGIEYWQPLFFSEPLPPLFSYFPANTLLVNTGDLETSAERFQADTLARFENRGVDPMRPLLPPQSLWLRVDELFSELKNWPRVQLKTEHLPTKAANANLGFQKLPDLAVQAQQKAPLDALRKFLETFDGPVVFSVESEGRREALGELLARIKIAPQRIMRLDEASDRGRYLMIGAAEHGFVDTVRNLALICESDLLGERVARRRQDSRRTINPDTLIRNLAELHIGQPRGRKRRKKCVMWRRNCWISTRNAPPKRASRLNTIVSSISCSATASRLKPRRIRRRPLMRYLATCVSRWQWIVWCAAMLALVKQKWRCAQLSWQ